MINVSPAEYICQFDSSNIPASTTTWTVTSPDTTTWGPSITTGGVVSVASGASAGSAAVVGALSGTKWSMSISSVGILSLTSGSALGSSDTIATIADSNGTVWTMYIDDSNQVVLTTGPVAPSLIRYPALRFSWTPASATDSLLVHSVRLNVSVRRRAS